MLHLDFLNKNTFRKFPIRGDASMRSSSGNVIPVDLISSLRISTPKKYLGVYFNKIFCKKNFVSFSLAGRVSENSAWEDIGSFFGVVTSDYQLFTLESWTNCSGFLTTGRITALSKFDGVNFFEPVASRVEDSLVFWFTPPTVTKIRDLNKDEAYGRITVTYDNITQTKPPATNSLALQVSDRLLTLRPGDIQPSLIQCDNPLITKINTVFPDAAGNIQVIGIEPVRIFVSGVEGFMRIETDETQLSRKDVCGNLNANLPPFDEDHINTGDAHAGLPIVPGGPLTPEWQTWPSRTPITPP